MAKKTLNEKDILKELVEQNVLNKSNNFIPTGIDIYDAFVSGEINIDKENKGHAIGKIISVSGKNGVGKSTLYLECSKRWCMNGYKVLYIDVEGGLNKKSLTDYGLIEYAAYYEEIEISKDKKEILEYKEKAILDWIEGRKLFLPLSIKTYSNTMKSLRKLLSVNKTPKLNLLIIDSIKDLSSMMVFEDDEYIEKQPMMEDAKSQENFLKSLKNFIEVNEISCILLNQVRITSKGHFYVEDEAGGNAFKHRCDIRLFIKEKERIYQKIISNLGEEVQKQIGNWVEIEVRKGRYGNPFSKLYLPIIFGRGVSLIYLYKRILDSTDIIKKSGSWYEFNMKEIGISEKFQGDGNIYKIIKKYFYEVQEYIYKNNLLMIEKKEELISDDEDEKEEVTNEKNIEDDYIENNILDKKSDEYVIEEE